MVKLTKTNFDLSNPLRYLSIDEILAKLDSKDPKEENLEKLKEASEILKTGKGFTVTINLFDKAHYLLEINKGNYAIEIAYTNTGKSRKPHYS